MCLRIRPRPPPPSAHLAQVASSAFFLFGVPFKTNFDKEVPHELGATPLSVLVAGVTTLALAVGIWKYNQGRTIAA